MTPRVVIVTEKPSVARDIARATGHFRAGRDCFAGTWHGKPAALTWAVGHLCELAPPDAYNPRYKRWSLADLPIIPERYELQVLPQTADRFAAVARLLTGPDVELIINACDAGREGELIFRYIYECAGAQAPVQRLWVSSLTDEAIRDGLANLQPGAAFDGLAAAARLRSQADWLVGLNATRAVTKRADELYSVGRVQTPTLALLVQREREIAQFVKEAFYHVRATFAAAAGTYAGQWLGPDRPELRPPAEDCDTQAGRLPSLAEAEAVAQAVQGQPGEIVCAETRQRSQLPPLLFDLTALQRELNQRRGFSASKTLALAQELYEKDKAITYPRTDSRHLTPDLVPALRAVLAAVAAHPAGAGAAAVLEKPTLPLSGRLVNAARVTDHHAIIPTRRVPTRLSGDKAAVYEAIVRRFVAAFHPPARLETTRVWTAVAGHLFFSRATTVIDPGWMAVAGTGTADKDEPLPPLQTGEEVACRGAEAVAAETRPPARYTEATLLRAMETAGRHVDESEPDAAALAEVMRETGLGTPATRAAIIERLLQVGYVRREKKALVPTPKGIGLIAALAGTDLVSPALTGRWEQRLRAVERGEQSEAEVRAAFDSYTRGLVEELKRMRPPAAVALETAATGAPAAELRDGSLGPCPRCGEPVSAAGQRYQCQGSAAQKCSFSLPRRLLGQTLTGEHVQALLAGRRTPTISGMRGKNGKTFAAALSLDPDGQLQFHFRNKRRPPRGRG